MLISVRVQPPKYVSQNEGLGVSVRNVKRAVVEKEAGVANYGTRGIGERAEVAERGVVGEDAGGDGGAAVEEKGVVDERAAAGESALVEERTVQEAGIASGKGTCPRLRKSRRGRPCRRGGGMCLCYC